MKEKEHRIEFAVGESIHTALEYLKNYIGTYDQQFIDNYSVETWIEDILYGLGMSIDPNNHRWARGHRLFKEKLIEYLRLN